MAEVAPVAGVASVAGVAAVAPVGAQPATTEAPDTSADTVAAAALATTDADRTPEKPRRRYWWAPRRAAYLGLVGGMLFFWMSLTPTLLPRSPFFQGLVSGVCALIGYGLGSALSSIIRWLVQRELPGGVKRFAWAALPVVALVGTVLMLLWWLDWQHELRDLMDAEQMVWWGIIGMIVFAVIVFVLLLGVSRFLRLIVRVAGRLLGKIIPTRLAVVIGGTLAIALFIGVLNGVVISEARDALNASFKAVNEETEAGNAPPTTPEISGSPDSLVTWDSLGRLGRRFVSTGPTPDDISAFTGQPATQPIRAYVGLASADSIQDRADLAVQELERTGAFDRAVLAVAPSTGTGWVNEDTASTLEYLHDGDTAIVSMQYSYLPSWLSFLVDKAVARDAGRSLFDAVYGKWLTLPEDSRPKLLLFGESLGSFGAEAAFSGPVDMANRTSGMLLVGPPSSNDIWQRVVDDRDEGSPMWQPIYQQGQTVRFGATSADLDNPPTPWGSPRIVYLQHASDPIVWWSPRLLFTEPDWLKEPRGSDVLPQTRWFPIITFLQTSADMAVSTGVPAGHGHKYDTDVVGAWVDILQPPDWTDADTDRLVATLLARPEPA